MILINQIKVNNLGTNAFDTEFRSLNLEPMHLMPDILTDITKASVGLNIPVLHHAFDVTLTNVFEVQKTC